MINMNTDKPCGARLSCRYGVLMCCRRDGHDGSHAARNHDGDILAEWESQGDTTEYRVLPARSRGEKDG